jgi:hypothetical protein
MSVTTLDELKSLVRFDGVLNDEPLQQTLDAAETIIARRLAPSPYVDPLIPTALLGPLPADLRLAVAELTRHLWRPRQGPSARGAQEAPSAPSAEPPRVRELLEPFTLPGIGFA